MSDFKKLFKGDMTRYGDVGAERWTRRWHYYFRKASNCNNKIMSYYYRFFFRRISEKHGMEISRKAVIGRGLHISHPYNITISKAAKLGDNINLSKGVTIGRENRGKRKGAPTIGSRVYIGVNSTVVGKITIGDDVLIAPNTYVNCDIPSHSIVLGSPCKIIPRENATESYVNHLA